MNNLKKERKERTKIKKGKNGEARKEENGCKKIRRKSGRKNTTSIHSDMKLISKKSTEMILPYRRKKRKNKDRKNKKKNRERVKGRKGVQKGGGKQPKKNKIFYFNTFQHEIDI